MRDDDSIDEFDAGHPWRRRAIMMIVIIGLVMVVELVGTPHVRLEGGRSSGRYAGVEGIRSVPAKAGVTPLFLFVPLETSLRTRGVNAVMWAWHKGRSYLPANESRAS